MHLDGKHLLLDPFETLIGVAVFTFGCALVDAVLHIVNKQGEDATVSALESGPVRCADEFYDIGSYEGSTGFGG